MGQRLVFQAKACREDKRTFDMVAQQNQSLRGVSCAKRDIELLGEGLAGMAG
jgi:hypothetical protein